MTLAAATVINQDEEAEKCARLRTAGCEIFESYRSMLEAWHGRLDLCIVPTGLALHGPMSVAALEAGCNVLVEKPLSPTVEEAQRMIDTAAREERFLAVGYQDAYTASVLDLKTHLLKGVIGDVREIRFIGLWPRGSRYYSRNCWAGKLGGPGNWILDTPANNAFAHYLNLALFLMGESTEAVAVPERVEAELYRARPIESADTVSLRVHCPGGATILFTVTHACPDEMAPRFRILGSRGEIHWEHQHGQPIHLSGSSAPIGRVETGREAGETMFRKVLRKLDKPRESVYTARMALSQTLCINGMHEAAPVRTIGQEFLEWKEDSFGERPVIREIVADLEAAFSAGEMPGESRLAWAETGGVCALDGYESFLGPVAMCSDGA